MRRIVLLASIFCGLLQLQALGQNGPDALTASFSKSKPVQLLSYSPISQTGDKKGKRYLKKHSDFTQEQVDTIFKRIVAVTGKPKGLTYSEDVKRALPNYKAYNLSDFSVLGYAFVLVWIPFEENQHMPDELRPTSKEGLLFYTSKPNVSTNGRDAAGKFLPKAGTAVKKSAGNNTISVSSADMSSQIVNGKIGVMIIYFGNKNTEIASRATAWTVYGNKKGFTGGLKNEKVTAEELAKRGAYSEYIGYHFIKGGDCPDAERYIKGKFSISSKDLRFFLSCIIETYVNND